MRQRVTSRSTSPAAGSGTPFLRAGFTLIEMLVVIGILLLIAAITLGAINLSISGDRVRGGARQVQSYLEGARSRAVYGGNIKAPANGVEYQCGVRFIRESETPTDPRYYFVSSMQYVEIDPANSSISGLGSSYSFARIDDVDNTTLAAPPDGLADADQVRRLVSVNATVTQWVTKYQQGLIYMGQTIVINSRKYQIDTTQLASGTEEIRLLSPLDEAAINTLPSYQPYSAVLALDAVNNSRDYKLILAPQPMANQDPRSLGTGAVIDLRSPTAGALLMSKGLDYFINNSQKIDIMFSPRGTVVGPLSGTGLVEFVVGDREDSLNNVPLPNTTTPNPTPKRDRVIVSLAPQTGMTAVHPVYIGATPDPYRYAETGEVARQ